MEKFIKTNIILTLLLGLTNTSLQAYQFYISDPMPEKYKNFDVEAYQASVTNNQYTNITPSAYFYYGIYPDVDIELLLTYEFHHPYLPQSKSINGIGDTSITSTICLLHESHYLPLLSTIPSYLIPTGKDGISNGKPTITLPFYAEKNWNQWKVVLGLGYTYNTEPFTLNYFYGGIRLGYQPTDALQLGAELYRQGATANTTSIIESTPTNTSIHSYLLTAGKFTLLNIGISYQWSPHLLFATSIGNNVEGAHTFVTYLGIDYTA
jgi:hypothetical protein